MKPDLSEFSFGFALTNSIISSDPRWRVTAPQFPSQRQEASGGYDVRLPALPMFLQFKLSDLIKSPRAHGSERLGVPHLRMHLRSLRLSQQHELLRALQATERNVYYAAPEFTRTDELNTAFAAQTVVGQTAFWLPDDIGALPDDGEHFVAFRPGDSYGLRYSHPREQVEVRRSSWDGILSTIADRFEQSGEVPEEPFFRRLSRRMLETYSGRSLAPNVTAITGRVDEPSYASASRLALGLFDSWLLLVQRG